MMSVMPIAAGREAKTVAGRELRASTGRTQRDTHVAWAKKAPRNLGGEVRRPSKRESDPSAEMRWKRYVPTINVRRQSTGHLELEGFHSEKDPGEEEDYGETYIL